MLLQTTKTFKSHYEDEKAANSSPMEDWGYKRAMSLFDCLVFL